MCVTLEIMDHCVARVPMNSFRVVISTDRDGGNSGGARIGPTSADFHYSLWIYEYEERGIQQVGNCGGPEKTVPGELQ